MEADLERGRLSPLGAGVEPAKRFFRGAKRRQKEPKKGDPTIQPPQHDDQQLRMLNVLPIRLSQSQGVRQFGFQKHMRQRNQNLVSSNCREETLRNLPKIGEAAISPMPAGETQAMPTATLKAIRGNGYGSHDPIHSSCGRFLNENEFSELLEALRLDFKNAPKRDLHASERFRYEHAAESRGDPDLYRQALMETRSGKLEDYDRLRLSRLLSANQRHDEALQHLEGLPERGAWESEIQSIRIAALEHKGRQDEIVALHKSNYERGPSPETYDAWIAHLPDEKRAEARLAAIELAQSQSRDPERGMRLLRHLDEIDLAAKCAIDYIENISGSAWYSLPEYAKTFEKANHPAAAILLYRKLLEDILDHARLKAYRHAARYWKKLDQLASLAEPPPPHEANAPYKAKLSEKHKRKSSFWRELG